MRVLVTGATGFVGGRVAARLRDRGDEVVAAVRTPSATLESLGVEQLAIGLEVTAEALSGVDAVVHAAASVGPSMADARAVNRDATRRIGEAALAAGTARLIHISTTSVYDLAAIGDVTVEEDAPLATEDSVASPAGSAGNAYAVTKAEAEGEVIELTARGLSTAILRPPAVLGAGPTSTWGTRVPRRLLDGTGPARHPETTFGFVHVEDLVDATLAALDSDMRTTVNVVGGHTTMGGYLRAIADLLPSEVALPVADPDDAPWRGRYGTARLTDHLGVRPARGLEDAMAEIAGAWRDGAPDRT
jgi:nucleoside-diphosphate-sugar epimerase